MIPQPTLHLLRKPMRRDLLLSDKWQTSDQACTSANKVTLTRLKKALKSSMQDFGIADLQKAVNRVGIGNEGNVTVPESNFSNQINCVKSRVYVCRHLYLSWRQSL